MKKSKQVVAGLLTAVMVCGMTACGGAGGKQTEEVTESSVVESDATETKQAETEETIETVQETEKTWNVDEIVQDAYEKTIEVQRQDCTYKIPKIMLEGKDIDSINRKIRKEGDAYVADTVNMEEDDILKCGGVSYEAYINGSVLTVLVTASVYPDGSGWDEYSVYNIDMTDNTELTDKGIWEREGYTEETFRNKTKEGMGCYFWNWWKDAFSQMSSSETESELWRFYYTISDANVVKAIPFYNKNGDLCVVGNIGSLAGGDHYPQIVDLSDYEVSDKYVKYIGGEEAFDYKEGHDYYADGYSSADVTSEDYILPESDSRYYTSEELSGFSDRELMLARNEIYARHGRKFNDAELSDYFNGQSWYNGTIAPEAFDNSVLNKYETENIDMIKMVEDM